MKSKVIALSAISASFCALALTLGAYIEFVDLVSVVLTSVFVILPLYYKSYVGSVLCYLAGGVLGMLLSGFNFMSIVFPAYFGFFGLFPIIRLLLAEKGLNKKIIFVIGLIWCVIAMYGIYFYYILVMGQVFDGLPYWIADNLVYFVGVVGIIFYLIFDRFIILSKLTIDRYLIRIIKK
ncbi:MAG: hypothetical protein E7369_03645 [Clostridiales bacterium]|nr:hypothetical protein [Clostridiales bacterium]